MTMITFFPKKKIFRVVFQSISKIVSFKYTFLIKKMYIFVYDSGAQYTSTVRTFFRFQTTWCACMVQCNAVQCNPWTVFYKSYNRSTTFVRYTHSIICKHQIFFKRKRIRNSSRVIYLLNTHFHPPKNTQTFAKNANTKNYFYKNDAIPCFLFLLP